MERFAALLDRLSFEPQRNGKLRLMQQYFSTAPDPDRGYALASLTGGLSFAHAKPALIRNLAEQRVDHVLFDMSYDYVGDLAETVALIWPAPSGIPTIEKPLLRDVVEQLAIAAKSRLPDMIATWLDHLDPTERWALIKLVTGGLRVGVSARLAKTAFAGMAGREADEIEEIWHGLRPPYVDLFAWLEGKGERPSSRNRLGFRPVMLAHALEERELETLRPLDFSAEWKWDGIRVQLVGDGAEMKLYSRTGEEIGDAFPDLVQGNPIDAVLDGELLVIRGGQVAPFADLQKRLNRKTISAAMVGEFPVAVRLYDILIDAQDDLRTEPFETRRRRLESWFARQTHSRLDLSPILPFTNWSELAELRAAESAPGCEGVMLKRRDSPYLPGRPKGYWYKWKRDPFLIDAVLMYAQRGHGKRSSYYSDYTFGCWRENSLLPVGKAYFGFSDEELLQLDRWVRHHTTNRFGPVREVEPKLVLEVAFEGIQRSTRHKSGVALRFPRINRIRWDKPANEADEISALERLLGDAAAADQRAAK